MALTVGPSSGSALFSLRPRQVSGSAMISAPAAPSLWSTRFAIHSSGGFPREIPCSPLAPAFRPSRRTMAWGPLRHSFCRRSNPRPAKSRSQRRHANSRALKKLSPLHFVVHAALPLASVDVPQAASLPEKPPLVQRRAPREGNLTSPQERCDRNHKSKTTTGNPCIDGSSSIQFFGTLQGSN